MLETTLDDNYFTRGMLKFIKMLITSLEGWCIPLWSINNPPEGWWKLLRILITTPEGWCKPLRSIINPQKGCWKLFFLLITPLEGCWKLFSLVLQDNDTKVRDRVTIYLNNKALYTNMTGYGNSNISARPSLYRSSWTARDPWTSRERENWYFGRSSFVERRSHIRMLITLPEGCLKPLWMIITPKEVCWKPPLMLITLS